MKKTIKILSICFLTILIFIGCNRFVSNSYEKYSNSFFDTFDTMTVVVGYTKSEEEFNYYMDKIHSRFKELHKLYDIYNNYEGINNIKTINDNAGIKPVKVNKDLIDLIVFSKDWCKRTEGKANIAMGSVLSIWHDYREQGIDDPENAKLPSMEELLEANKYTDIDKVIVDTKNSTVYLEDKKMKLDVGSIAKGYATELVAKEIMEEGFKSGIISSGGNIRVLDKPLDGVRKRWGIGIQNPNKSIVADEDKNIDTIFINNASVVSSGDYQRYYIVNDKRIHHIIDPKTLMPGEYYRAVTIVTKNSALADLLSTAIYLMPYIQSRDFVERLEGVEAIWVMPNGKIEATKGMEKIMKSKGASGVKSSL